MGSGLHHSHRRKRIYQRHEEYPHPDKLKRLWDRLIYVAVVMGPAMTLPQVWKIFSSKSAASVSVLTWGSYAIVAAFWLIYGILHKEKPVIIVNAMLIVLQIAIVVGALLYG